MILQLAPPSSLIATVEGLYRLSWNRASSRKTMWIFVNNSPRNSGNLKVKKRSGKLSTPVSPWGSDERVARDVCIIPINSYERRSVLAPQNPQNHRVAMMLFFEMYSPGGAVRRWHQKSLPSESMVFFVWWKVGDCLQQKTYQESLNIKLSCTFYQGFVGWTDPSYGKWLGNAAKPWTYVRLSKKN